MRVLLVACVLASVLLAGEKPKEWKERLGDRVWWFKQEKEVSRLHAGVKQAKQEAAAAKQAYTKAGADKKAAFESLNREFGDNVKKQLAIHEKYRDKKIGKDEYERLIAKGKATEEDLKREYQETEDEWKTRLGELKSDVEEKNKAAAAREADIEMWVKGEPEKTRQGPESQFGGIYKHDMLELFEHIENIVPNYVDSLSRLDPEALGKLHKLPDDAFALDPAGNFKDPLVEQAFLDPKGVKVVLGRLRAVGKREGYSEADRAMAMKLLLKGLFEATRTQAGDNRKMLAAAEALYRKLIMQKRFVLDDLMAMYGLFLGADPEAGRGVTKGQLRCPICGIPAGAEFVVEGNKEGYKRDDKWVGPFITYHDKERTKRYQVGCLGEGKQHGPYRIYHENGRIRLEGRYVAGEPDGVWRSYSREGKEEDVHSWRRGLRHGRWYDFGHKTPIREGHYHNGKPHGTFTYWFRDSSVKEVTYTTHNGYKHGLLTWYYPDGQVRGQATYANGIRTSWKAWRPPGKLVRDVTGHVDGPIDKKKFKNTQWEGLEYMGKYKVVPNKQKKQ